MASVESSQSFQATCQLVDTDFSPQVTATCKAGHMNIKVAFNNSFYGAVHARDFRTPACMTHGDGGKLATLDINLLALHDTPDYCGLLVNNVRYFYCAARGVFPSFKCVQERQVVYYHCLLSMVESTQTQVNI